MSDPLGDVLPGRVAPASRAAPQIHAILRRAIIEVALEPGRHVSEGEVAEALGVSRTPVREAFIRLGEEGLILAYPKLGSFVAPIRRADLVRAQFVREALECAVARRVAETIAPPGAGCLRAMQGRLESAEAAGDLAAFDVADEGAHRTLAEESAVEGIWAAVVQARGPLDRARRLVLPDPATRARIVAQHAEIVEAVTRREPARAAEAMRVHTRDLLGRLSTLEERHPSYFREGPPPGRGRRRPAAPDVERRAAP